MSGRATGSPTSSRRWAATARPAARARTPTGRATTRTKISPRAESEPAPLAQLTPFEEGDFRALEEPLCRDPQHNDRRLIARRKLAAIASELLGRVPEATADAAHPVELSARTSLHHPHAFNHMKVRRLWAYVCRGKKEKSRLKQTIGAELAKDLDAAYRNAFLCAALESDAVEVSLRVHPEAWYDGQNLVNRIKGEGLDAWLALLDDRKGFRLRLDDWKGEWVCGRLDRDRLGEFLKYYVPGEHGLTIERRLSAPRESRAAALDPGLPRALVGELEALLPLYRFSAWSRESDFLFAR